MHVEENPYRPTTVGTAKRPGRWAYFLAYGCFGSVLLSVGSCVACPFVIRSYVPRNEALVMEDIRMVMSAEEKYAAANGGYYDRVECLLQPAQCIPSYPEDGPIFLEGSARRVGGILEGVRGL